MDPGEGRHRGRVLTVVGTLSVYGCRPGEGPPTLVAKCLISLNKRKVFTRESFSRGSVYPCERRYGQAKKKKRVYA